MDSLIQDVRYALRQLRRAPAFALTAVAVLALGLGANLAVFTLLYGVLLRPLPYGHPEQLVTIALHAPNRADDQQWFSFSYANMLQLRDAAGSDLQTGAVMNSGGGASVVGPGGRFQVNQTDVTAGMLRLLGVAPSLGRDLRDDENEPGKNRVALIGDDVWHKLFGGDPQVLGKTLTIRGTPYTIVGVLPKSFFFRYAEEMIVWTPAAIPSAARSTMSGDKAVYGTMYGRVRTGVAISQVMANLNRAQPLIAKETPDLDVPSSLKVQNYQSTLVEKDRRPLSLLYAVVAAVWALACLNVMSLMLTRAVARTREQAVRSALGASRKRLMQQAVIESALLSGAGALLGVGLAQISLKLLWHQIEASLSLTRNVGVDWRMISGFVVLTVLTTVITGVFPAMRAMRRDLRGRLAGTQATASTHATRTRETLVVAQLALTLMFLVGAGLFVRTIHAMRAVPLGFSEQNVLTGGIILNPGMQQGDESPAAQTSVVRTEYLPLLARLRAIPGVKMAALSSVLPMRREMQVSITTDLDHKKMPRGQDPSADGRIASPGLVDALGIPMVRGRFFTEDDTDSAPPVVVINQAFANKYLPGQDPTGHIVSMGKGRFENIRIVGVIGDMKQMSVADATRPEIYFPLAQVDPGSPLYGIATAFMQVAIRAAVPAGLLRAQFEMQLHEVAPDAITTDIKTIHEAVEDSFGSQKLIERLLTALAVLALVIATVGLYALLAFAVALRTREIGVRIALGAAQQQIMRMVIGRALALVGIGLAIGAVLAWFAGHFAKAYLYGVGAHDGLTFLLVVLLLMVASFLAAWLPARRAAAIDPMLALRSE